MKIWRKNNEMVVGPGALSSNVKISTTKKSIYAHIKSGRIQKGKQRVISVLKKKKLRHKRSHNGFQLSGKAWKT